MTNDKFNEILERRLEATRRILEKKAEEYSTDQDRLHNFKRAAKMLGVTPEQALLGMKAKHDISIMDMVNDIAAYQKFDLGYVEEKIGDSINYLVLLEALIIERGVA